jgi:hypothetical protein
MSTTRPQHDAGISEPYACHNPSWACPLAASQTFLKDTSPPDQLWMGSCRRLRSGYGRSSSRTLAAWGPLGPEVMSNSTACPSSSER